MSVRHPCSRETLNRLGSTDDADGQGNDYGTYALTSPTFSNGTTIPNGTYKCAPPVHLSCFQLTTAFLQSSFARLASLVIGCKSRITRLGFRRRLRFRRSLEQGIGPLWTIWVVGSKHVDHI